MVHIVPNGTLDALRHQLVVSVQADDDSPLRDERIIVALARAAEVGGARALRLRGAGDVRAVRSVSALPIIGLTKTWRPDTEVYITPTPQEAAQLAAAGSALVAFDATQRARPFGVRELVEAVHAAGALALADVSTLKEAQAAMADGADLVSTTLSGYTAHSPQQDTPDWELMRALRAAGIPFVAEGRLRTPGDAVKALELGAHSVVVGSAITRPDDITKWFVTAMRGAVTVAEGV